MCALHIKKNIISYTQSVLIKEELANIINMFSQKLESKYCSHWLSKLNSSVSLEVNVPGVKDTKNMLKVLSSLFQLINSLLKFIMHSYLLSRFRFIIFGTPGLL